MQNATSSMLHQVESFWFWWMYPELRMKEIMELFCEPWLLEHLAFLHWHFLHQYTILTELMFSIPLNTKWVILTNWLKYFSHMTVLYFIHIRAAYKWCQYVAKDGRMPLWYILTQKALTVLLCELIKCHKLIADYTNRSGIVRKRIAVCATSTAPLRELTCHMGSPGRGDIPAFIMAN